jgi:Zn-dependent protease with chaperone function
MLETYGLEELRYVFIHELAHLKQRDIYLGWLMALLHVAHWFNPLIWFAFSRIRADREIACDRLAISTMEPDEPHKYGRTIVSLLESFSQTRYLPSVAGILEETCQMERRIKMIADYRKTPRPRWAGTMLLLAVLACIVLTNAYVAKADFTFGTPTNLGPIVNSPAAELGPDISADGLSLFLYFLQPGGDWDWDILVATRETRIDEWGSPVNLGSTVNSTVMEVTPSISADGLSLYFGSTRPGGSGDSDIWVTTRATTEDDWGTPENLGPAVNNPAIDMQPSISSDGLSLYFGSNRANGFGDWDIWVSTRASVSDSWSTAVNLGSIVNSSAFDSCPAISADGLTLLFTSTRSGGYGSYDLYVARRTTLYGDWGTPVNLGPTVNSSASEIEPSISSDGRELYFSDYSSPRPGGLGRADLWQVSILPIVDFNGDGNIDNVDLLMLVESWGKNDPLYDIGPTPHGDDIVDMADLEVFMSYWEKENVPEEPEEGL